MFFWKKKEADQVSEKKSWYEKLKERLFKSSSKISSAINDLFTKRKLDQDSVEELEEILITSDFGVNFASKFVSEFSKEKFDKEISPEEVKQALASYIVNIFSCIEERKIDYKTLPHKPYVMLFCGVNGSGKTTTIGKIASKFTAEGKKVVVAACDTFRAAASDQLKIWAERSGSKIFEGKENSDAAAVAYSAVESAIQNGDDVVLIDTAGRLQNKQNLMEELAKILRVIKKLNPEYPHETSIVLDATVGQNALSQIEAFHKAANLSSLIITKLDGTAKAGVLASITERYKLPVLAIGIGEKIEDLDNFDAQEFAKAILDL